MRSATPAASRTRWETKAKSRAWCSTPRLRSAFALAALVLGILAATLFRPPPTSGPFARDFEAYYAAGATWNRGGNPWSRDVWTVERTIPGVDASRDELLPFVGPSASLPLWSLLARLPFDAAREAWITLLLCAYAVLVYTLLALTGLSLKRIDVAGAALVVAASGPFISDVALGQVALLSAAGAAIALLSIERKWPIAALAGTLVAALQPNLAVPLGARLIGNAKLFAAVLIAFCALTFAFGGHDPLGSYRDVLIKHGISERFLLIQYGIPAILASFGVAHDVAGNIGMVMLFVLLLVFGALTTMRERPLIVAATAFALLPLAISFFHEHDFVIELIPLFIFGASDDRRLRAVAGFAAICILADWFGIAQRPHAALQTASAALAVACAWIAFVNRPDRPRQMITPLVTIAVVAGAAIPLALAHPAPVWPDMLGAFHAAANADASSVWAAEQQRAGLVGIDPVWGALRAIPIIGCATLAIAGIAALWNEGSDATEPGPTMTWWKTPR